MPMRTIILLFVACSLFLIKNVSAKDDKSKFFLKVWDDSEFTIIFDSKVYNTPTTKFKLNRVKPGKHKLKVIKEIHGPLGYSAREILFKGSINIPPTSKVVAKINRYNDLVIISIKSLDKDDESDIEKEKRQNMLSIGDFKKLKEDIEEAKYESDKLDLAKSMIGKNMVRTNQIFELIELFGFESTKLEFAMYVYPYVVNKKNFAKINEVFIKSTSIKELEVFIKDYHDKNADSEEKDDF